MNQGQKLHQNLFQIFGIPFGKRSLSAQNHPTSMVTGFVSNETGTIEVVNKWGDATAAVFDCG